jgi:hypothetical protein
MGQCIMTDFNEYKKTPEEREQNQVSNENKKED